MAQFMLILRGGNDASDYTPEQYQGIIQRYFAWSEQLRSEGRFLGGDALENGGRVVRRDGDQVVDGPFAETKETVGGYYLITAAGLDEAAKIAKGCPILDSGGLVEVRQVSEYT
jgi:hypothetical protein